LILLAGSLQSFNQEIYHLIAEIQTLNINIFDQSIEIISCTSDKIMSLGVNLSRVGLLLLQLLLKVKIMALAEKLQETEGTSQSL